VTWVIALEAAQETEQGAGEIENTEVLCCWVEMPQAMDWINAH
jgi:hypothetical protein